MGGLTGGGGGGKLPGTNQVANQTRGMIGDIPGQNIGAQYLPQFQDIAKQQAGWATPGQSSGARGVIRGAQTGSSYGGDTAKDVYRFGQGLLPYAKRIGNMGFDPQNALYKRTLQQVQDQQRAGQAARGIAMSPYGAGLEGDATRNFNIDWRNTALKRATDAATAVEGLGSSAFNLGSGATDLAAASGKLPYQAKQGLLGDKAGAYSAVGNEVVGANAPRQQAISDFLSYLGMGPGYQGAAAQQQNANTGLLGTIGQLALSTIAK